MTQLEKLQDQVAELEKAKTQLRQKLEKTQGSERRYEMLIREQGEGIAIVNPGERFVFANPAAERIFGVEAHGLTGRSLEEFVEPEQFKFLVEQTKKRRKGEQRVYDHQILRPDGGRRHVIVTVTPYFDEQKQFQGTFAIFRDITERKWAEETVKEQKDILGAIVESSLDGILVVDELGKVTHTNGHFARMWRIPKELIEARDDKKLLDYVLEQLENPQLFLSKVQRLYNSDETDFDTLFFKDGRVFRRSSFPLMRGGKISGRVWNFRDVTEEKRVEEEKEKLEKQLQQALKMEAIGTLAGGIAHDFNNILGAIIGYTELAGDDIPESSATVNNLRQVLKAANRAKELVKQILAFSRKNKEERKPLYLAAVVDETLKLLRASLPATIAIRSDIEPRLNPVPGNRTQLHQVMMNLCTNAAYAMREKGGGGLEIGLKEIDLDQNAFSHQDLEPGRYQQLSVSDTGNGIPGEIISRIFEPYFTTKEHGEGSGMGLAVVYGIVKSHGGIITVYSEPGKGTTFQVFFKAGKEDGSPLDIREQTEQVRGGSERILFVDDEQDLAELGKRMLDTLGYHVVSTTDSLGALDIFSTDPAQFDLVISDQTMPRLTGVGLIEKLKQIRPDIPVILCTGFSEHISAATYKSQGISAFLMKPISRTEIARVVRTVLDRGKGC